ALENLEHVRDAETFAFCAMDELEVLDDVLDVANPSLADLDLRSLIAPIRGDLLHLVLQAAHLLDALDRERRGKDEGLELLAKALGKLAIPRDMPETDESLPLPVPPHRVVVVERGAARPDEASGVAFGAETRIETIELAFRREPRDIAHQAFGEAREEGLHLEAPADRSTARSRDLLDRGVPEELEVDVARIVELESTELSEREDRETAARRLDAETSRGVEERALVGRPHQLVREHRDLASDAIDGQPLHAIEPGDAKVFDLPEDSQAVEELVLVANRDELLEPRRELPGGDPPRLAPGAGVEIAPPAQEIAAES